MGWGGVAWFDLAGNGRKKERKKERDKEGTLCRVGELNLEGDGDPFGSICLGFSGSGGGNGGGGGAGLNLDQGSGKKKKKNK